MTYLVKAQALWPELHCQEPHSGRREQAPTRYPLIPSMHTQNQYKKIRFLLKTEGDLFPLPELGCPHPFHPPFGQWRSWLFCLLVWTEINTTGFLVLSHLDLNWNHSTDFSVSSEGSRISISCKATLHNGLCYAFSCYAWGPDGDGFADSSFPGRVRRPWEPLCPLGNRAPQEKLMLLQNSRALCRETLRGISAHASQGSETIVAVLGLLYLSFIALHWFCHLWLIMEMRTVGTDGAVSRHFSLSWRQGTPGN